MNYFDFYGIPVSFLPDEKQLRVKYLELGKKYHPDFYTTTSGEKQSEILELSTMNNKAFKVLGNFDNRMRYILMESGVLEEEEKYELPQIFLMEMMDLNEILMEMQFDPDPDKKEAVLRQLDSIDNKLYEEVEPLLIRFNAENPSKEDLARIKEYYYKNRYLLRIREQLDKFASPE